MMEQYRLNVSPKQKPEGPDLTSANSHHPRQEVSRNYSISKSFFNQEMKICIYPLRKNHEVNPWGLFVFLYGEIALNIQGIHPLLEKKKGKCPFLEKFQLLGIILFAISIIISILVAAFQKPLPYFG